MGRTVSSSSITCSVITVKSAAQASAALRPSISAAEDPNCSAARPAVSTLEDTARCWASIFEKVSWPSGRRWARSGVQELVFAIDGARE